MLRVYYNLCLYLWFQIAVLVRVATKAEEIELKTKVGNNRLENDEHR